MEYADSPVNIFMYHTPIHHSCALIQSSQKSLSYKCIFPETLSFLLISRALWLCGLSHSNSGLSGSNLANDIYDHMFVTQALGLADPHLGILAKCVEKLLLQNWLWIWWHQIDQCIN